MQGQCLITVALSKSLSHLNCTATWTELDSGQRLGAVWNWSVPTPGERCEIDQSRLPDSAVKLIGPGQRLELSAEVLPLPAT